VEHRCNGAACNDYVNETCRERGKLKLFSGIYKFNIGQRYQEINHSNPSRFQILFLL